MKVKPIGLTSSWWSKFNLEPFSKLHSGVTICRVFFCRRFLQLHPTLKRRFTDIDSLLVSCLQMFSKLFKLPSFGCTRAWVFLGKLADHRRWNQYSIFSPAQTELFPFYALSFFSAEDGSADFDEFMALLGEKIRLKDWERYRGGLDVKG